CGDERVSPAVRDAGRGAPSDADVAAADSARRRTGRCRRSRATLRRLPCAEPGAEAVHQCGSRRDLDRPAARVLPDVAESARSDDQGRTFSAGGFAGRDRGRNIHLAERTDLTAPHDRAPTLTIRLETPADIEAVFEVEASAFGRPDEARI